MFIDILIHGVSGDRTPKQKMKMDVSDSRILKLFEKYGSGTRFSIRLCPDSSRTWLLFHINDTVSDCDGLTSLRREVKLKTKQELGDVVACANEILDSEGLKQSLREKYVIVREVTVYV